jgi:hypothetical protein
MSADTIARLKITLDDVRPAVLRRIEVPFDIRLDRLHLAIQAAMGWTNTHLYEIRARHVGWSTPDGRHCHPSSGAACDDVEHQSQHRHPDCDCSDRQRSDPRGVRREIDVRLKNRPTPFTAATTR